MLDVDGVWSILPSPSLSHVTSRRLGLINPTKSDVLLLLQYKYDIIKERLYREMLQEEHGVGWWESMEPSEQTDCVCDVEQRAEEAFKLNDVLCVCELPGVLHCYRGGDEAELHSCRDEVRVRERAWTSSPRGQSWTSAIFLCELRSHCEEERRALTRLLNRVERLVLTEIYLSVCVSVRRAERETHSHTALLTSRQHWDNWPYLRRLGVEELVKFWLQEKQDPATPLRNECRTSRCVRQAVLQCVVLCQEQERRTLMEILHSVSQEELQEQRHTLTLDYKAAGTTGSALRRGCVSVLRQIKSSLHCSSTHSSVSWADCAVHLLAQLTHTHDEEVQTVIHTLPVMDAAALMVLLHKYELELRSPKLHNLHNLLQTSGIENTQINVSVTDSERTEQRQNTPSVSDAQQICTGCGVVLVPEDAPYLEILGVGEKRDDERKERREGEEEERREGREEEKERRERREGEEKEWREGSEGEEEERREGREGEEKWREGREVEEEERRKGREGEQEKRREGNNEEEEARREGREGEEKRREGREEEEEERREGEEEERRHGREREKEERRERREGEQERRERREGEQERRERREGEEKRNVDAVEKQGSLITLAWSKPASNNTQEVTSALPEAQTTEASSADSHTPHHTHSASSEHEHTPSAHRHTLVEPLQEQSTSSMDAQNESSSDEHGTTSAALELDLENAPATGETHTQDGVCDGVCEEQQLQRDATMRSLVDIQRRAEQRWQRDRDRQILRVQERLSIIQNRKSDEDVLGLRREETFRHLTNTLQQEDEQQQKMLVREKLQQLWRERSCILQTRRERNTTEFKELLTPTAQCATNVEDVLDTRTHTHQHDPHTHQHDPHAHQHDPHAHQHDPHAHA
ncbi:myb-like protein X [Pangasianodon hypophthalmus]|uniref:myb-like protein X n=1 Tax=Pangasianodon hypophthalmus TaxID=310915 RepID=UPI0023077FAF|nr:myb-like protein X [Pangasianodon hypophthalmus]